MQVRVDNRVFEIGAGGVRLNTAAVRDIHNERRVPAQKGEPPQKIGGVLFPGPDHGHILVATTGKLTIGGPILGYEVNHTDPDDPFRWARLKEIVDKGALRINGIGQDESRTKGEKVAVLAKGRYVEDFVTFRLLGLPAFTLLRLKLQQEIDPGEPLYRASPSDKEDTIYYASNPLNKQEILPKSISLAHEFFGHVWLATRKAPNRHPGTAPASASQAEKDRLKKLLEKVGTLRPEHQIAEPFGRIFSGTVENYIARYVESNSDPREESPTEHVSERFLKASLDAFAEQVLKRKGLTAAGLTQPALREWIILSRNYSILQYMNSPTASGTTPTQVVERVRAIRAKLDDKLKLAFDAILTEAATRHANGGLPVRSELAIAIGTRR